MRFLIAWFVRAMAAPFIALTSIVVSAEGLRWQFEDAAVPLYRKWPLMFLRQWEETKKLDYAICLALAMAFVSWACWDLLVGYYMAEAPMTNAKRLTWAVGAVFMVGDTVMFWSGIHQSAFGGTGLFAATVLTALYIAMLVFVSVLANTIQRGIK